MTEALSIKQARKLVLLSQRLPARKQKGTALSATLSAIEHLGYVQMDTISVIQRAHHHTLWNRNPRYQPNHLDALISSKQVFEYWSHAAAYLPMRDFRYSLYKKQAILSGDQSHWYKRNHQVMKEVLSRIEKEGPLMARDFDGDGRKLVAWQHKSAKMALENLYMQGDLMVSSRVNFHKVYDLTERVLPQEVNTTIPTDEEYARYLIFSYLRANGIAQLTEISYLLKGIKPLISLTLKELVANKEVVPVSVKGIEYYSTLETLSLLNRSYQLNKLHILSPFDNLLIQRKRMQSLFDFDYLIECYTPEVKRKFGYFSLPILWNGQLIARMDCKAFKDEARLEIFHLALETKLKKVDDFIFSLKKTLPLFMNFNGCETMVLHKTTLNNKKVATSLK
ncbi:winged helix-turn-helix domain-containing protein [Vibrio algarum]|uniref:Crosslink repair DNA glycosylase YcaQ family protein n=1 Tax=Vibrio algarum TaxID=3020714 RepID=A0ABT4YVB6_9VIBR|nr:crosslink repair DNA glycosylase YcaQ family protein [Vibrio sp. KJ40-1]MDB1125516.1 crosslink repair DNA glycosylase YcaQ family protein [Vibrio sp. KJ40-1]